MAQDSKELEAVMEFLKENRGAEGNFQKIYDHITAFNGQTKNTDVKNSFEEILQKLGGQYKNDQEKGISNWQGFESFVSALEKAIIAASAR